MQTTVDFVLAEEYMGVEESVDRQGTGIERNFLRSIDSRVRPLGDAV